MTKAIILLAAALGLGAGLTSGLASPAAAQSWSSNAPNIGPVSQPEGIRIEAYPAAANYCPNGYQPVVVGGVICCGIPNATYSAPAPVRSRYRPAYCPAGTKGCG
ncbi:hypothetical protein [Shimia sp.]|uniref:hypothetical protein n=1 Tax=Shimia sp. TaxID=1954381 RepID=UPI0035659346